VLPQVLLENQEPHQVLRQEEMKLEVVLQVQVVLMLLPVVELMEDLMQLQEQPQEISQP